MGRNKWYWLSVAPLYNFHYEGPFSSWYESFESRTRIPREALTYMMTALIGAAYLFTVLWSDARLIWGCGISLAFGLPFPLFLYDICRGRFYENDTRIFWVRYLIMIYWLYFHPQYQQVIKIDSRVGDVIKLLILHRTMKGRSAQRRTKRELHRHLNVNMNHWSPSNTSLHASGVHKRTTALFSQPSTGSTRSSNVSVTGSIYTRKSMLEFVGGGAEELPNLTSLHDPTADVTATKFHPEPPIGPRRCKDIDYGRLFNNGQAKARNESSQTPQRFKMPQTNGQRAESASTKCSFREVEAQSAQCDDMKSPSGVVENNERVCHADKQSISEGISSRKYADISRNFRDSVESDPDEHSTKILVQDRTDPKRGESESCTTTSEKVTFFPQHHIGLGDLLEYSHNGQSGTKRCYTHRKPIATATIPERRSEASKEEDDLSCQNINDNARIVTDKEARQKLFEEAKEFLDEFFEHEGLTDSQHHRRRLHKVNQRIRNDGYYEHTREELIFGAKRAYRETASCLGRKDWESLQVFDCRRLHRPREMFNACCHHISYAMNGGRIRPTITIFRQSKPNGEHVRIWNDRLIRYAGYRTLNGTVTGDPATLWISKLCRHLGWKPRVTNWDILPLLIQVDNTDPLMFTFPLDLAKTVLICHPRYIKLETLNLHWYALPSTTDMALKIGGIEYGAAPFSGIHVASAIAKGPLNSETRYNFSAEVGKAMDMDVTRDPSEWRDKAVHALEEGIVYSFQTHGISILNDATIAEMVEGFIVNEEKTSDGYAVDFQTDTGEAVKNLIEAGALEKCRRLKLDTSPSKKIAFFHRQDETKVRKYVWTRFRKGEVITHLPQRVAGMWHRRGRLKAIGWACRFFVGMMGHTSRERYHNAHILYSRMHGVSHRLAEVLKRMLQDYFVTEVEQASEFDPAKMKYEDLIVLVVEMSSSNGWLRNFMDGTSSGAKIQNLRFAILVIDSSASPEFGTLADRLSSALHEGGAVEIMPARTVDELNGRHEAIRIWAHRLGKALLKTFGHKDDANALQSVRTLKANEKWKIALSEEDWNGKSPEQIRQELERIHYEEIYQLRVLKNVEIRRKDKSHRTLVTDLVKNDGRPLSFSPGDDLGVIPQNHPKLVQMILSRLRPGSPGPDQPFYIETETQIDSSYGTKRRWKAPSRLPPLLTLKEALTYYLDITTPPTQDILADLVHMTDDDREKKLLSALAHESKTFDAWRVKKASTFPELLQTFPKLRVDPALLLTKFPTLQPRLYAIASSPAEEKIRITTAIVKRKAHDSNAMYGVCSNWIASHHEDCLIFAFVRRSESFHLPSDASLPVVMIGAGVSIAPFRSFWNERIKCRLQCPAHPEEETLWGKWGKLILFMGCRSTDNEEIIFDNEIKTVVAKNHVIAKFATSRGPRKNEYVMDLLRKDAKNIFKDVVKKGGHIYLSGDENMIYSCNQEFIQIFHMEGNMTLDTAEKFVEKLQCQGRFHEKNFGLCLHRDEKIEAALAKITT